jgi:co-chaperonin GroES (HSP10)
MNTLLTNYGSARFRPLNDRVLVKRINAPEPPTLIYLPDIAKENSKFAEVMAIGTKVYGVNVGDIVLLPGVASKYPDWEHNDLMFVEVDDIGGIVEPDQA